MLRFPFLLRKLNRFSLLWLITVPFLFQTTLTTALIGYLSFRTSYRSSNDLAFRLVGEMSDRVEADVQDYLSLPHQVNATNQAAIMAQELDITDAAQMSKHFWSQSQGFPELDFIYFGSEQGGMVLAGQQQPGDWIIRKTDRLQAGTYQTFATDETGNLLQVSETKTYDARIRPWYQAAKQQGQAVWSPVYVFNSRKVLGLSATLPVYDAAGRFQGVLASDFSLDNISEFLHALSIEQPGEIYIMEEDGNLIATSASEPTLYESSDESLQRLTAWNSKNALIKDSSTYLRQQFQDLQSIPIDTQLSVTLGQMPHYMEATHLTDPYGLDWIVVTVVPESAFMSQVQRNFRVTLFLCGMMGLASIGFGWLLYRGLLSPITSICREATALTKGNWDFPITSDGSREFGQLSEAFQIMRQQAAELKTINRELDRATRLKDEFLANMSHELRTPLNAILGMTEGLQEEIFGAVNEQQMQALGTIERSGNHLLSLITDILDVAKIESGTLDLDYSAIEVGSLCRSSLAFIKQQAYSKRIQIETRIPQDLPPLNADERRIRQVLINLLSNAVKFTAAGGQVVLEVSYIRLPQETEREKENPTFTYWDALKFDVIDTGIGISEKNLKKLFQPFIQVDSNLNRQYEGTGLGLALVKRIVELHGGTVSVTSTLGAGSCFSFTLPLVDSIRVSPSPEEESTTSNPATSTPDLALPAAPWILLAEDNEANLTTLSTYFEAKGYRFVVAKDGEDAIALAKSKHPDLILMDIQLPRIDGFEVIRQIRAEDDLATVPIIALTAMTMPGDKERCLEAGASEYLGKPFKLKRLTELIHKWLK